MINLNKKNLNKKDALSNFIAIASCIVGIWVASVFTVFQTNAESNSQWHFEFSSWIDDKTTTLQELNFTDQSEQTDIISSFYMRDNSIILTPSMTISWYENTWNILWWASNQTDSLDITIIWWSQNRESWSGYKTILWWNENQITSDSNSSIVWWSDNRILWDGSIIWWLSNRIWENAKNIIIIWWSDNEISDGSNIIAAWKNIIINNAASDNSFIFSNYSSFSPEKPKTFYINAQEWLWLNWDSNPWTINSHWWLSVWEINLNTSKCTSEKIGIIWKSDGCLIACTEYSSNSEKRSLLESTQKCLNRCKENSTVCSEPSSDTEIIHTTIPGFCTWDIESWSTLCFNERNPDEYDDVVFINNYVDECPNDQRDIDNPCTYTCPSGQLYRDWSCKKSCTKTWDNGEQIIIPHWESIRLYNQKSPACPSQCIFKERKCNNWNLETTSNSSTYIYTTCQIREWTKKCDSSFNLEAWDMLSWWNYSGCTEYTINWNSCSAHTKYRLESCKNGYTLSWGVCYKNCSLEGISVPFWKTITWYMYNSATCDEADKCKSYRTLTCREWWLSDVYEYPYSKCDLKEVKCPNHTLNSCPNNWICTSCTWYTLNNHQCVQFVHYKLESCISWYTIDWNTCKADCTLPWWGKIHHNDTVIWYKSNTQTCPSSCASIKGNMVCNNWTLSWSSIYTHSGCTTLPPASKWFKRNTRVNNAICESEILYSINNNVCVVWQTKYKCTACEEWYTRNGQDRDWDNVKCLGNCSFTALPDNHTVNVENGYSITTYQKWTFTCPKELYSNYSQIRTCNDWTLSGSFLYTRYTQKDNVCEIENTENVKTFTHTLNQTNDHVELTKTACTDSQYNGTRCVNWNTYYTYRCKTNYKWSSNWTKCVWCEWDIPANAHKNNSNYPSNDSIEYYYNTNESLACTFSCDEWSSRDGEQCASDNWKCYIEGTTYNEWANITAYEEKSPICSNTCNQIRIQCRNGVRYDYNNYRSITWNISTSCHTKSGYVTNTSSTPRLWYCIVSNSSTQKTFEWNNVNKTWAILNKKCTNYESVNATGCVKWTTYRTYSCPGKWVWTAWNEVCKVNCTHNGESYEDGTQLTMYNKRGNISCPNSWQSQTRICDNGNRKTTWWTISNFGNAFIYEESEYHLTWYTCDSSYNLTSVPAWSSGYDTCVWYSVVNNTCNKVTKYKATNCDSWYSMVNNQCKKDCYLDGRRFLYWQTGIAYNKTTAVCPNECSSIVRTCGENWQRDGDDSYKYYNCSKVKYTCSSSEYPYTLTSDIPAWANIKKCTWYTINGDSCQSYYRYGINECESWYSMVNNECKKDCNFNWHKIKYWDSVTGYMATNCPWPCFSQSRTCGENWNLLWNSLYSQSECIFISGSNNCTANHNLDTCPENGICDSCLWYDLKNNLCLGYAKLKFIKCNTGYTHVINTGYVGHNNENQCKKNCTGIGNLGEIAHWGSVTAYKFENGECKSLVRFCNNGVLDGDPTYNLKWCESCTTPRWDEVSKWTKVTAYNSTLCPSTTCWKETLECDDTFVGDVMWFSSWYLYESCISLDNKYWNCTPEHIFTGGQKQYKYIYTGWCLISKYNGYNCNTQEYFKIIGCNPPYILSEGDCQAPCTTPRNSTVVHWTTVTWYKQEAMMCSDSSQNCVWESRKCLNWHRYKWEDEKGFWEYTSIRCNMTGNDCSAFPYSENEIDQTHCNYSSCTTYTVENWSCKSSGKKYALYGVKDTAYYASGSICNRICGDGASTQCNWPYYTATWYAWYYSYPLIWDLYSNSYTCYKNLTGVNLGIAWADVMTCYCPVGSIWLGSYCGAMNNDLCNSNTIYGCNDSYVINQQAINWGYIWSCKNTEEEENCHYCNNGYEWNATTETCEKNCPAPTITNVEWKKVYFTLNWATANALAQYISTDWENRSPYTNNTSSPQQIISSSTKWFIKLKTVCTGGIYSDYSNTMEFNSNPTLPTMRIDDISQCKIRYHFNEYDPISNRPCCNPVRLERSYDGTNWSMMMLNYSSWMKVVNHWDEWMVYFRYSIDGWENYSPISSYNMPFQRCYTTQRKFYNDRCLNWLTGGLYLSDWTLLTTISNWYYRYYWWAWSSSGYTITHPVSYNDWYNRELLSGYFLDYSDKEKVYNAVVDKVWNIRDGYTIQLYTPCQDEERCKFNFSYKRFNDPSNQVPEYTRFINNLYSHVWHLIGECY